MAFTPAKWSRKLRSQECFGGAEKDAIYHQSWMKNQGLPAGRPVIGIRNTWSELMKHPGSAVVFEDIDDCNARVNDHDPKNDETCAMVLKNCGPCGCPDMTEVDNKGLPPKIQKDGVTDMMRISGARMSGTAFGIAVLDTSPVAAVSGPLAVVQSGDMIELEVEASLIHLDIADDESQSRLDAWNGENPSANPRPESGYAQLYHYRVLGADTKADFNFLVGCWSNPVGKEAH